MYIETGIEARSIKLYIYIYICTLYIHTYIQIHIHLAYKICVYFLEKKIIFKKRSKMCYALECHAFDIYLVTR